MGDTVQYRLERMTYELDDLERRGLFTRAELATAIADGAVVLPTRTSVARALIEDWYGEPLDGGDAPR